MTFVMARDLRALFQRRGVPMFAVMASLSHRQGWSLALILVLFPGLLFGSGSADDETLRYRVGTSEVRLSFFATDQNGRPLDPLTK
ncbi:MAG TPA: hypothetical protein VJQ54_17835, partial [Candidatus Sulfotelmatobacter sp.]|nr:hypothetical protein [Candidatus Sulfotelmatobacter sp.]